MDSNKRPNFLIIGSPKAGTTALAHLLRQHPDVFLSEVKECCYFAVEADECFRGPGDEELNSRLIRDQATYETIFATAKSERARGEASVWYLYSNRAAARISSALPAVRLIAILRNPIERAFSSYMMARREGREPFSEFQQAIEAEPERIRAGWEYIWHYVQAGFYARQLKRYYSRFDREQLKVFIYEDFRDSTASVVSEILRFLEVDSSLKATLETRVNVSGIPKSRVLHRVVNKPNSVKKAVRKVLPRTARDWTRNWVNDANLKKASCPEDMRRHLATVFSEDILELQDLLSRDLSIWTATAQTRRNRG